MASLHEIIRAAYPDASPRYDYVLQDDGAGPYLAAWNIDGPLPEGVTMITEAMRRFEAEHKELRDAAENLFTRLETMRKFLRANQQIAAEVGAAATADTIIGGGTMTKSAVSTAMLLYAAGSAFASSDLALAANALAAATTEAEGACGFSCEDAVLRMG